MTFLLKKLKLFWVLFKRKNENELVSYIETKKQNIVAFHIKHNPFYCKSLTKSGLKYMLQN